MKVVWMPEAQADVAAIAAGRAEFSERSAGKLAGAIIARADQVADFPYSGRVIPEFQVENLREVLEQVTASSTRCSPTG